MGTRLKLLGFVLIGLAATGVSLRIVYFRILFVPRHPMTLAQARTLVDGSLPIGSTRDGVERWITSQNLGYLSRVEGSGHHPPLDDVEGPGVADWSTWCIEDTERGLNYIRRIDVYFSFDARGRLVRRTVSYFDYCL